MNTSYIRGSIDGPNGSGKTCTTAQLAVGLAKEYGDGKPVVVFDSSNRWRTWKKRIFDVEKISLQIVYGQSIAVLQQAMDAAMTGACSVFIGDDLTVPWLEGVRSFAGEAGNLTFSRREQLYREWNQFVLGFQHGPFHALACGRRGYVWENVEDEEGEEQLHQGDAKFNAGGGHNFGYDADLELAVRRRERKILGFLRGKITVEHVVDVRKDAHAAINSQQFVFPEWPGEYKPGMYRTVLDCFRPHIEFVRSLDAPQFHPQTSRELIVSGKTSWAKDQTERKSLLEELGANLDFCFPSGEGKSKLSQMFQRLTLEYLNGYVSWSRMEEEQQTEQLERNLLIVKAMRKRVEEGELPTNQDSLKTLLDLSTEDVFHPGRNVSLLEAMGLRSLEAVGKRGPERAA